MQVIIIEDEKIAAKSLEKQLSAIDPQINVVEILPSIRKSVRWLSINKADLIFLDIQLADGLSFKIFEEVKVKTPIIFTTAYDQYAIKAFELNSIDYLLKPIDKNALEKSLNKLKELQSVAVHSPDEIRELADLLQNREAVFQKRFMVYAGDKVKSIKIEEVAYFYSMEKSTFLCTKGDVSYTIDYSLDKLELMIDPDNFFRINRKFIIHIDAIKNMFPLANSRMKIELIPPSHEEAFVSLHRYSNFKRWLNK